MTSHVIVHSSTTESPVITLDAYDIGEVKRQIWNKKGVPTFHQQIMTPKGRHTRKDKERVMPGEELNLSFVDGKIGKKDEKKDKLKKRLQAWKVMYFRQ